MFKKQGFVYIGLNENTAVDSHLFDFGYDDLKTP